MPDYKEHSFLDGDGNGLWMALMDRMRRAKDLSPQEQEDTFRDAAFIGPNINERYSSALDPVLHPLKAIGIGKPNLPDLPDKPARFRPDPLVVGQPDKARAIQQLLENVPDLKSPRQHRIVMGPTDAVVEEFANSPAERTLGVHNYDVSNLLGMMSRKNGDISINPGFQTDTGILGRLGMTTQPLNDFPETAAHELMHGRGYDENAAYKLEKMIPGNIRALMQSIVSTPRRLR